MPVILCPLLNIIAYNSGNKRMNKDKIRGKGFSSEICCMGVYKCTLRTSPPPDLRQSSQWTSRGLERFQIHFSEFAQKICILFKNDKRPKLFLIKFPKKWYQTWAYLKEQVCVIAPYLQNGNLKFLQIYVFFIFSWQICIFMKSHRR